MTGTFRLWIELGNDAMSSRFHIRYALKEVCTKLNEGVTDGKIRDANGNAVGQFSITEDDND